MPGVHQGSIAIHPPLASPLERHDVELAVGTHQLSVAAADENNQPSVGRYLWEVVAHAVFGRAGNPLRPPSLAVVEGDAIKVILDLGLVRIVGMFGQLARFRRRILCFRPGKDDVLAIRTPDRQSAHSVDRRRRAADADAPFRGCTTPEFRGSDKTPGETGGH